MADLRRLRRWIRFGRPFWVAVVVAAVLSAWVLAHRQGWAYLTEVETLELETLDLRFRVRGPQPAGEEIALLAFDDRTLDEAPHLFERRAGQAEVIRAAQAAGVEVLGVDLLFADPELLLAAGLIADIDAYLATPQAEPEAPEARALLERVQDEVHGDEELARAIDEAGNVVLAFHIGQLGNLPTRDRSLRRGKYAQVVAGADLPESQGRVLASEPLFNEAAVALGLMTTYQDASGSVRDVPLGLRLGPSVFAPLAVQLVARHEQVPRSALAFLGSDGTVRVGERSVQSEDGRLLLNFRGPTFATHSVIDLVEGRVPEGALDGKVAIFGYTHLAQDAVNTPFGRRPGMEVHATAVDNILRGDPLRRASPWRDALYSLVVGLLVAFLFTWRRLGPPARIAGSAVILAGALAGAHGWFVGSNLWVSAVGPLLVGGGASGAALAAAYLDEGVQRRFLRKTFAHYLSPELVEELVRDPARVTLSGERRELSVLFSDIRDFTAYSERVSPLDLASFLNAYFTPMTRAVLDNDGYVDKFIGDAVMAIFGAPVHAALHVDQACQAALDMLDALREIRPLAAERGLDLHIGVGVNTGEMVVGNMGSETRFDYTVLGDAVNLASRIEGLTKRYGVDCLVGEQTAARAGPGFRLRAVDLVRVKGKAEPVELFQLCAGPRSEGVAYQHIELYEGGLAAYRDGDFRVAREQLGAFLEHNPDDQVAALLLSRIEDLGEAPTGWDGVYTHRTK